MDRDKLYKQASSAASNYANHDGDEHCLDMDFYEGFKQGAEWLMGQPLSERLTEDEMEKIIERYNDELESAQYYTHKMKATDNLSARQSFANIREDYISRIKLLEAIFGKEMFNKE